MITKEDIISKLEVDQSTELLEEENLLKFFLKLMSENKNCKFFCKTFIIDDNIIKKGLKFEISRFTPKELFDDYKTCLFHATIVVIKINTDPKQIIVGVKEGYL